MRIGFFQFSPVFGDPDGNADRIIKALEKAGADLLVAPELALSGYTFTDPSETRGLAQTVPGPITDRLVQAVRSSGCSLVLGLAEEESGRVFNSAVLITPDGAAGVYRKIHLFNKEKEQFSAGDRGFPLFGLGGSSVGLLVCFDHMFPEAARSLALQGARIVCHPANLVLPEYGQLTTRVRALENRVFWVLANRYGVEDRGGRRLQFTGCSQIVAPDGRVLESAPADQDALNVVEIEPEKADDKRVTGIDDLFIDRKPDLYHLS